MSTARLLEFFKVKDLNFVSKNQALGSLNMALIAGEAYRARIRALEVMLRQAKRKHEYFNDKTAEELVALDAVIPARKWWQILCK